MFRVADGPLVPTFLAALYLWVMRLFYSFASCDCWDRSLMVCLLLRVRSEVEKIVHRMSEILFAAKVAFRGLDRCMPQQELNLLQLTTAVVKQFRTGSTQVVRGNVLQSGFPAAGSDYVPDNVL